MTNVINCQTCFNETGEAQNLAATSGIGTFIVRRSQRGLNIVETTKLIAQTGTIVCGKCDTEQVIENGTVTR